MIVALDGPAEGRTFAARRAPVLLRLVVDGAGKWDCLDALLDEPRDGEDVHVYRLVEGTGGVVYVRPGGCYAHGDYRHVADAPSEGLRETLAWRRWAMEQPGAGEEP